MDSMSVDPQLRLQYTFNISSLLWVNAKTEIICTFLDKM